MSFFQCKNFISKITPFSKGPTCTLDYSKIKETCQTKKKTNTESVIIDHKRAKMDKDTKIPRDCGKKKY